MVHSRCTRKPQVATVFVRDEPRAADAECGRRRKAIAPEIQTTFSWSPSLFAAALSPLDNPAASANLESGCCDAVSRSAIRCNGDG